MDSSYEAARWLARRLGDPDDPGRVFSDVRSAAADEQEEFPGDACRELDAAGMAEYYVPVEHGGALRRYDELLHLMRVVAGRDLTVAIAHGKTFLGAVCVWVAGSRKQCRQLGVRIRSGQAVALALTEEDHGSDLLAGQVTATAGPRGWRLAGGKWLINNANRAELLTVLARTRPEGGPRGFGLVLVDKQTLAPGTYRCLPRIPTHGIRGADIAGIEFHGTAAPLDSIVGTAETGLETVLKSLQITRTLCAALSLGAADHALRIALDFAHRHTLYGRHLVELPEVQRILVQAWTDIAIAEALGAVAARSVHTLPDELAVTSAVVKSFVPTSICDVIGQLGKLLGARAFLLDDVPEAGFQKVERDHAVVGVFDGSTVVNLHSLINHLPAICAGYRRAKVDWTGLGAATHLDGTLPPFDRGRLTLLSLGGSSLVQALPELCQRLVDRAHAGVVSPQLGQYAERLRLITDELHAAITAQLPVRRQPSGEQFALARRYALCFSAAACIAVWLDNQRSGNALWTDGGWLAVCLDRLLGRLGTRSAGGSAEMLNWVLPVLREQHRAGGPFWMLPVGQDAGAAGA